MTDIEKVKNLLIKLDLQYLATQDKLNIDGYKAFLDINTDIKDFNVKDALNVLNNLEKQLAEKDKYIKKYKETIKEWCGTKFVKFQNQKAIEQLEKVKGNINKLPITDITDYGGFKKIYQTDATRIIDQKINELKGEQK